MTKIYVTGKKEVVEKDLTPIEFLEVMNEEGRWNESLCEPGNWNNLQLLVRESYFDLILAWNDDGELENNCIYKGHWNDGVVE